jgi:TP901 family phage tail tape measure protein
VPGADPIEVILQVRNLRRFIAQMSEASLAVKRVGAAGAGATAAASAKGSKLAGVLAIARKGAVAVGIAAATATYEGFKLSSHFQQEMLRVHTQAGLAASSLGTVSDKVLEMARHTQFGPVELARSLFHIQSVSGGAGSALNTLTKKMSALHWAAKLAALSGSNLEETTNAIAQAAMVGIPGLRGMHNIIRQLNATAGAGNMRMNDLVSALGAGVLPVAKLAGLRFRDVGASLAILADEGIKGYSAGAQLRTSLHYLYAPSGKAADALKTLHLSAKKLHTTMKEKGLVGGLALLRNHLEGLSKTDARRVFRSLSSPTLLKGTQAHPLSFKSLGALGSLFPAGRGTTLQVLMNQVDRFGPKYHQMGNIARDTDKSIAKQSKTAQAQIHTAWSSLQVDLIHLGDQLRGPITKAVVFFLHALSHMVHWLSEGVTWVGKHKHLMTLLGVAVGGATAGFIAYKVALAAAWGVQKIMLASKWIMWWLEVARVEGIVTAAQWLLNFAMDANPIALVVIAAAALAVGLYVLWTHSKTFRHIVVGAMHAVKTAAVAVFGWIKKHWPLLLIIMGGPFGALAVVLIKHFSTVTGAIKDIFAGIVTGLKAGINAIIDVINVAIKAYNALPFTPNIGLIHKIGEKGPDVSGASNPFMAQPGGTNSPFSPFTPPTHHTHKTHHQKKAAHPALTPFTLGNDAIFKPTIPVYLDGKKITEVVGDNVAKKVARR